MTKQKVPVQIRLVKDPDGKEVRKATVPFSVVLEKTFDAKDLEEQIAAFEDYYFEFIKSVRNLLGDIRNDKNKSKVLLYWQLGDQIIKFIEKMGSSTLYLENAKEQLKRDAQISDKMLQRCKKFRWLYPDLSKIDPKRSFDSYVSTFEGGYISVKRKQERGKESKHA